MEQSAPRPASLGRAEIGSAGEELVAQDLRRKGYTVLTLNYTKPYGEIDVIARRDDMLIFVEVKTRTKNYFDPAELVTPAKQKRILTAASSYIFENNYDTMACRFDIALISWHATTPTITYLHDAFGSTAY